MHDYHIIQYAQLQLKKIQELNIGGQTINTKGGNERTHFIAIIDTLSCHII